jgi:hypothetical protein
MDNTKYIGMDVHKETISIAVLNSAGKLVMESVIETKAITIVQFVQGLRGDLQVTLEEGTWAAWLYDLLRPHVNEVLVCDPRKNALLKAGNKSDQIDARKLAELLFLNKLTPVYHGEHGVRVLKELSRSYLTISGDLVRVMTRLKAVYRSWAIPCAGKQVYGTAAQQPGVSNPDGVRGGNRRGKRLWKRRCVEKYKPLFHSAWKSRKPGGIPTFPQPRRRRAHPLRRRADSEPSPEG